MWIDDWEGARLREHHMSKGAVRTSRFIYGTELKSFIDKLKKIILSKPSTPAELTAQLDKGAYKEE
eukprot:12262939-Ditylum_brightwellii.AAC.2